MYIRDSESTIGNYECTLPRLFADLKHCTIKTHVFCRTVHTYFVYGIKLRNQASVNNCKAVHSLLLIDASESAVREQ